MKRSHFRFSVYLLLFLVLGRLLWISSLITAPFFEIDEAPKRQCQNAAAGAHASPFTIALYSADKADVFPLNSKILSEQTQFAYAPEKVTSGVSLREIETAGCRWYLGHVPADISHLELRRFAVSLRHVTQPVIIISDLPSPFFSLSTGLLARAAFLTVAGHSNIFNAPRILASYGVNLTTDGLT